MTTARLYLGDAVEVLTSLNAAPPFATCVTSPPFWGRRAYTDDDDEIGRDQTIGEYTADLRTVFAEVRALLADDGILWLNLGDTSAGSGGSGGDYYNADGAYADRAKYRQGKPVLADGYRVPRGQWSLIPERVVDALQRDGWYVRSKVIWCKPRPRRASKDHERRPGEQHESIYMLTKTTGAKVRYFPEREVEPGDVWHFPPAQGSWGKAPFPLELPRRCIEVSSEPGDHVLDPFVGGGATVVAALDIGRHACGVDLDPEAIAKTEERVDAMGARDRITVHTFVNPPTGARP